jgi:hypothetical protein
MNEQRTQVYLNLINQLLSCNEGEVVQQAQTEFGQQFKVDWTIPNQEGIQLRTIWELTSTNSNPRLISAFIR